jgi:cell division protein FtsQ
MSNERNAPPATRTWREIPQKVKRRSMSPEGKRRLAMNGLRLAAGTVTFCAVAWGAWRISDVLRDDAEAPSFSRALPIGDRIVLTTDGVLDRAWLVRTLALPQGATLMGLDLRALQSRVLAGGQAASAAVIREFPATLAVHLSERTPVAAIMGAAADGSTRRLLVARDGAVYDGVGYDPAVLDSLPWLDGVRLVRRGAGFAPIPDMPAVAELLARAQLEAAHLYRTWRVASLARLESDGVIAVTNADGLRVEFGTREGFLPQLARLDTILDSAAKARPGQPAAGNIDLSLGPEVPVRLVSAAAGPPGADAAVEGAGGPPAPGGEPPAEAPPNPPKPAPAFASFQFHLN